MKYDILWKGDYISVISPQNYPYETILERNGIAVLPIINNKIGIRKEVCPPYLIQDTTGENRYYTIITGGIEKDDNQSKDPINTVMKELKEEGGITVIEYDILYKKLDIPVTKSTTLHTNIYILDILHYKYTRPKGDGTKYEAAAKTVWVTPQVFENIINQNKNIDYLLVSMFYILKDITRTRFFWSD